MATTLFVSLAAHLALFPFQSSPEQLDLTALRYQIPLATYLLLFVAAWLLTSSINRRRRCMVAVGTLVLAALVMYYNGLFNSPSAVVAGVVVFVPAAIAGAGLGFAGVLFKKGRSLLALLPLCIAVAFIVQQVVSVSGRQSMIDYPYQGTGLFIVLPFIGGIVFALSLASGQKRRTCFVALWLLFVGTIGLGAYINLMEGITYAFVAPDRMFGLYANIRVAQATIEAVAATFIYVAGSLMLLALPFGLDKWPNGKRSRGAIELGQLDISGQAPQLEQPRQTHFLGHLIQSSARSWW